MWFLRRYWMVLVALLVGAGGPTVAGAASAEDLAYNAASAAFSAGFYERAEGACGEFVRLYPASPRVAEVVLIRAQSRMQLKNFDGALELLQAGESKAGTLADQYVFRQGESLNHKGDYQAAADQMSRLTRDFPTSSRRLEAVVIQASALSRLAEWDRVIGLLTDTNAVFALAAHATPTNGLVLRGSLTLAEAQFARKDHGAAERALQSLGPSLHPRLEWQRQLLASRIYLATSRPAEAISSTTNLIAVAGLTGQPGLVPESIAFQGGVLEELGRFDEAIAAYERNLGENVSEERQRQALLKIAELALVRTNVVRAVKTLETFTSRFTNSPLTDLALLTLGDLQLSQAGVVSMAASVNATNAMALSNHLQAASSAFTTLAERFPQSSYVGKARLGLGWSHWLEGRWAESAAAFQQATERLASPEDLALAYFKLGDAQLQQGDATNALRNYQVVAEKFGAVPTVQSNLLERSFYQVLHAGRRAGNPTAVTNALMQLLTAFPNGFLADRSLMFVGNEFGKVGNPALARELFSWAATNSPGTNLQARLQLAMGRTYEQEGNWPEAVKLYSEWLGSFGDHVARPRVEYDLAWASYQAGQETNALAGFTNFLARFPDHELSLLAGWWVGDFYLRSGNALEAEKAYQLLFKSTNWPVSRLTYEAQLMAGRAAMARLSWENAKDYFLNLYNDTNAPTDLRVQSLFSYGDYWMSRDSTNKLADYDDAIAAFSGIWTRYPSNSLAPLALGKVASCYLQKAQQAADYQSALTNFQQVINSPLADITARSIATVGLAVVMDRQAKEQVGADQVALRKAALNYYLDVFYGKILREGEAPDLFWVKKAGLDGAELALALQEWSSAIGLYQQLVELLPQLRTRLEKSIAKAREQAGATR